MPFSCSCTRIPYFTSKKTNTNYIKSRKIFLASKRNVQRLNASALSKKQKYVNITKT